MDGWMGINVNLKLCREPCHNPRSRPLPGGRHKRNGSYGEVGNGNGDHSVPPSTTHSASAAGAAGAAASSAGARAGQAANAAQNAARGVVQGIVAGAKNSKVTNNEKTLLLSSDDEFQ